MAPERRRQLLLGVLLVVLLGVLYRAWSERYPGPGAGASAAPAAEDRRAATSTPGPAPAQSVHLSELDQPHPKPPSSERDLFRFRPKPPPPPPPPPMAGSRGIGGPPGTAAPSGPPPPPPIALKFIGAFDQGPGKPKLAILSDGLGPPMYGVEGGVVAGRYRIVRIGAESIEMEYLDGRGRQTIRLTGS